MAGRRMTVGVAAALACLAAGPAAAQPAGVRAGVEAWQRGDYETAVERWRPLAQSGNSDAQFNLGQAYKLGRGVKSDLGVAQMWLDRAAHSGHLEAQTSLGLLLFQGGNRITAMRWLKSAADRGEPRAMVVYGTALYNGDGVARDPVQAYAYVRRAAGTGFAPAAEAMAQMDSAMPAADRQKAIALIGDQPATRPAAPRTSRIPAVAAKPAAVPAPEVPPAAAARPAPPARPAARPAMPARVARAEVPARTAAPRTETAAAAAPAESGWRLQLGAFSRRGAAEALFRRLSGNPPLAGKQSYLTAAGAVTRLQAGPFASKTAAVAACESLQARGQPCFVVRP